ALENVVRTRDQAELALHKISAVSRGLWLISLIFLGSIWLLASRSSSRRNWSAALDSRRSALAKALEHVSGEDLRTRALGADQKGVEALDAKIAALSQANSARIDE